MDTDSKNQPHIVMEPKGGIFAYHKIDGIWYLQEPILGGRAGVPFIRIDENDNAWISTAYVEHDATVYTYNVGGRKCCNAMSLFRNIAEQPQKVWGPEKVNSGFVQSTDIDPYSPNKAYQYNQNDIFVEWTTNRVATVLPTPTACCGGEKGFMAISPRQDQEGIVHTTTEYSYRNQLLAENVIWSGGNGNDHAYPGVGIDLTNPDVAYLSGQFSGFSINIWTP